MCDTSHKALAHTVVTYRLMVINKDNKTVHHLVIYTHTHEQNVHVSISLVFTVYDFNNRTVLHIIIQEIYQ